MAKRKKVKKKAKKKVKKRAKKTLKYHAKELHAVGKKYASHTAKTITLHKDKKVQAKIKKQLKILEKALKDLVKLESR